MDKTNTSKPFAPSCGSQYRFRVLKIEDPLYRGNGFLLLLSPFIHINKCGLNETAEGFITDIATDSAVFKQFKISSQDEKKLWNGYDRHTIDELKTIAEHQFNVGDKCPKQGFSIVEKFVTFMLGKGGSLMFKMEDQAEERSLTYPYVRGYNPPRNPAWPYYC